MVKELTQFRILFVLI